MAAELAAATDCGVGVAVDISIFRIFNQLIQKNKQKQKQKKPNCNWYFFARVRNELNPGKLMLYTYT